VLQLNGPWLHVSAALRPSSGQLLQIKRPQCAYNMGSDSVYSHDMYGFYLTYVVTVHTMGSHIVRTLRALNL